MADEEPTVSGVPAPEEQKLAKTEPTPEKTGKSD